MGAQLYAKKFGIGEDVMLRNLWGERYFNPATSSFVNKSAGGKLKRGFVHFILQPIYKLTDAVIEEEKFFSKKAKKEVLLCFKKSGTITDADSVDCHNISVMK